MSQEISTLFITPVSAKASSEWVRKVPPGVYQKEQILFYEGHLPYGIYVIHKGKITLTSHKGGQPVELGPGTMIGMGLLEKNLPYPYTAIVSQDIAASFLEKSRLQEWQRRKDSLLTKS